MKKLIPVILCCAMLLAACGSSADSTSTAASSESSSAAESTIGGADGPTDIVISESTDASAGEEANTANLDAAVAAIEAVNPIANPRALDDFSVENELMLTMDFRESAGARMSNVTWRIEPETILVSGPAEVLNNMDSIVLDEFDLASLGSTTNYSYAIPIPEGCENLSGVTRATLRISFNDLQRSTVTASNFILTNAPEDRSVDLLTEQLSVGIFGTSADVAAITEDNILVTVDLSDFGSAVGTYTVPAEVTVVGRDVGVSGGPYRVRVTISEQSTDQPAEPDTPAGENPDTGDETT